MDEKMSDRRERKNYFVCAFRRKVLKFFIDSKPVKAYFLTSEEFSSSPCRLELKNATGASTCFSLG